MTHRTSTTLLVIALCASTVAAATLRGTAPVTVGIYSWAGQLSGVSGEDAITSHLKNLHPRFTMGRLYHNEFADPGTGFSDFAYLTSPGTSDVQALHRLNDFGQRLAKAASATGGGFVTVAAIEQTLAAWNSDGFGTKWNVAWFEKLAALQASSHGRMKSLAVDLEPEQSPGALSGAFYLLLSLKVMLREHAPGLALEAALSMPMLNHAAYFARGDSTGDSCIASGFWLNLPLGLGADVAAALGLGQEALPGPLAPLVSVADMLPGGDFVGSSDRQSLLSCSAYDYGWLGLAKADNADFGNFGDFVHKYGVLDNANVMAFRPPCTFPGAGAHPQCVNDAKAHKFEGEKCGDSKTSPEANYNTAFTEFIAGPSMMTSSADNTQASFSKYVDGKWPSNAFDTPSYLDAASGQGGSIFVSKNDAVLHGKFATLPKTAAITMMFEIHEYAPAQKSGTRNSFGNAQCGGGIATEQAHFKWLIDSWTQLSAAPLNFANVPSLGGTSVGPSIIFHDMAAVLAL